MSRTEPWKQRVALAAENVGVAEREVEAALAVLSKSERFEKQMITSRLESAFSSLAAARRVLEEALATAD